MTCSMDDEYGERKSETDILMKMNLVLSADLIPTALSIDWPPENADR